MVGRRWGHMILGIRCDGATVRRCDGVTMVGCAASGVSIIGILDREGGRVLIRMRWWEVVCCGGARGTC